MHGQTPALHDLRRDSEPSSVSVRRLCASPAMAEVDVAPTFGAELKVRV